VKNELELLVALQKRDFALDKLREKSVELPQQMGSNDSALVSQRANLEDAKNNVKRLQLSKKEKELELSTKENDIKKHNMELNTIKSNDTYKALLSEINTAKLSVSAIEDDILNIMEGIEKESKRVKEEEAKLKAEETQLAAKNVQLKSELDSFMAELAKLEVEREEFAKQIPNDLLSSYEGIRASRQGIAIVPLEGENCGGCGMNLRAQNINDIIKGQEVVCCDSCQRILYRPNETQVEKK